MQHRAQAMDLTLARRKLDRERAYPVEFVNALTEAGFLAALIPEEYGGSGLTMSSAIAIMEEIQAAGCNGAPCHAQMYMMGTVRRRPVLPPLVVRSST